MLAVTVTISHVGDTYVTRCNELAIETYGRTMEDAWRRTLPMIRMHLEVCEELGKLDEVLAKLGAPSPHPPLADLRINASFSTPLYA